ncbi:replication-associated protein [Sonfela circovirus 2]|uniref:Replication-associated protein n=1 Tax=Sonfela circovirus 2 TaxID=2771381 RepID=A0A7H1C8W7_9CIRC|nr:replication-associated protein [Sonfela circovirus 2]QNS17422.1 replication-associated protein [Sonfela circovirus 2]
MPASYRWAFTLNNPTDEEKSLVRSWEPTQVKYLIAGEEVGDKGTPHLQGFVNLVKKARLSTLKKKLPRAHFEKAKGTDADNKKYCSKEGKVLIELGEPCKSGQRSDLQSAVDVLLKERSLGAVAAAAPEVYVKYYRGLAQLLTDHPDVTSRRSWKTEVSVFVGPPGTGKSRECLKLAPDGYWKPRGKWWCGYNRQEDVIMDDFYGWLPYDDLLRVMDRYPLKVETKGGTRDFLAKRLFITSNRFPHEWYNPEIVTDALYRRINVLKVFDFDGSRDPLPCEFNKNINY